jgi:hypothetical protein
MDRNSIAAPATVIKRGLQSAVLSQGDANNKQDLSFKSGIDLLTIL